MKASTQKLYNIPVEKLIALYRQRQKSNHLKELFKWRNRAAKIIWYDYNIVNLIDGIDTSYDALSARYDVEISLTQYKRMYKHKQLT